MVNERIIKIIKIAGFMAILLLSAPPFAHPENIVFKSPVVWRTDGAGDYLLPESSPGIFISSQVISCDGTIESIRANWEFEGEVTLEVSADNGANFVSVVNGVPLTTEFKEGSKIKWRANIAPDSVLEEVKISYTDASGQIFSFGDARLSGFKYRKLIAVSNSGAEDLFNYQLKIKIGETNLPPDGAVACEGNIEADFKDIRFTVADGETLIPYYIEKIEGVSPDRTADVWVKIPQIPPQGLSLYIYYGNSSAEDLSAPENVFDFFDDFAAELDAEKWELTLGEKAQYSTDGVYLKLMNAKAASKNYRIKDGIIEYKAKAPQAGEIWVVVREEAGLEDYSQAVYSSGYSEAEHCIAVGDIVKHNEAEPVTQNTPYSYRVILENTNLTFQRYSDDYAQMDAQAGYNDEGGIIQGAVILKAGTNMQAYFDWIRTRRYSPYTITITQNTAQEQISLPEFSGMEVNEKGNLVLENGAVKGSYVSQAAAISYGARILISQLTGQSANSPTDVQVDISLDGGSNYCSDCESGKFYYASKEDFTAGNKLKFNLKLTLPDTEDRTPDTELTGINFDCRPGTITLISPNGGENLTPGKTCLIMWSAVEYENTYPFKLDYSLDAGKSYNKITDLAVNTGSFMWTVPGDASNSAVVKISDAYAPAAAFDISDGVFSIRGSAIDRISSVFKKTEVSKTAGEAEVSTAETDLSGIIKTGERPNTKPYDVVIKIGDPGAEAAVKTSYEGEIVMVIPGGNNWSDTERRSFLIIPAHLTEDEVQELTAPEVIQTGKKDVFGNPEAEAREKTKKYSVDFQKLGLGKAKVEKGKRNIDSINETLERKYIEGEVR